MKTISQHREDATLDKMIRYEEGVMTRREWLKLKLAQESTVFESEKPQIEFNGTKYNRMNGFQQDHYMKKCENMVPCYNLQEKGQRGFWEITKIEYNYFKNLELAQDKATEKHDFDYRLKAGIATDDEIKQAEQNEVYFFTRYC